MFQQLRAIFRNTLIESIRQPIYIVLIGLGILALVFNLSLSSYSMDDDNKMLLDMGMATIFLMGLLISAFIATSVLSREIEDRTVLTVVSKPVGRPLFVFGKYLGVTTAILIAATILAVTFLLTIRHEVLQRAADEKDGPVIVFGVAAVLLSVGLGAWCNYFYNWVFTSTTIAFLLPLSLAAWAGVLFFSSEWKMQSPATDFDPQMMLALLALALSLMVMSAVAVAASTRLGQTLTVFVCVLVFLLGLLSDHLFGSRAFEAKALARIVEIEEGMDFDGDFADAEDWYAARLDRAAGVSEGLSVIIASDAIGLAPIVEAEGEPPVQIRNLSGSEVELVRREDGPALRPPRVDDYLFREAPKRNALWMVLWALPPNLQTMILIDPLTQGHAIPGQYIGLLAVYSGLYTLGMLALAVLLFQTREVG